MEDDKEQLLADIRSEVGSIIQTIENHMLRPLEDGMPVDHKRDLERIRTSLSRLYKKIK